MVSGMLWDSTPSSRSRAAMVRSLLKLDSRRCRDQAAGRDGVTNKVPGLVKMWSQKEPVALTDRVYEVRDFPDVLLLMFAGDGQNGFAIADQPPCSFESGKLITFDVHLDKGDLIELGIQSDPI